MLYVYGLLSNFGILNFIYEKKNITETACSTVIGFSDFRQQYEQHLTINGRSKSTYDNYIRCLARLALYFDTVPTKLEPSQINEYLFLLSTSKECPSNSYFKLTVYGLRSAYRLYGVPEKGIFLPSIKKEKRLPTVLSKREIKCLIETPKLLKHRVLLGLLYGCGLRCSEARNIKLSDLDFDRRMLHIRQGKGKKDRYVPLSSILIVNLKRYLIEVKPENWLFNGKITRRVRGDSDNRYSQGGVKYVVKQASKEAGIIKQTSTHTLRHTYATHLLEDGLDIVTIKELLGHSKIETTMVYLHVAQ